jgi:hypothetical protein
LARPRVFISSTYYDLKTLRTDLEHFVREQGYEPVLFERGQVSYGKDSSPEEYCHKEIEHCDILVSIIGGKIGSTSQRGHYSISQIELKTALEHNKQVYIFVERDVYNEYRTYSANRDKDVDWQSVNDKLIFEFIAEVYSLPANNAVMAFETSHDIVALLREQWAGLFQRLLMESSNQSSYTLMRELKLTLDTSRKLAEVLAAERHEGDRVVQDLLLTSHPIFGSIREKMSIPYRVFFTSKQELDSWLGARTFKIDDSWSVDDQFYQWENDTLSRGKSIGTVQVLKDLFDADGGLKTVRSDQWDNSWVQYTVTKKKPTSGFPDLDDDVPF